MRTIGYIARHDRTPPKRRRTQAPAHLRANAGLSARAATDCKRTAGAWARLRGRRCAACLILLSAQVPVLWAADTIRTIGHALRDRFPDARIERTTVFLTGEQQERIETAAGSKLPSAIVHPYRVWRNDRLRATVYFDTHPVRSHAQTLMVAVDAGGRLLHLELLAFHEPPDFKPPPAWFAAFVGRRLSPALRLGHGVDAVTGATLSSRATVKCVRRVLATHDELSAGDGSVQEDRPPTTPQTTGEAHARDR